VEESPHFACIATAAQRSPTTFCIHTPTPALQRTRPMNTELIPITEPHHSTILALNNQHTVELSLLDHDRLRHLLRNAYYARMTRDGAAFLLAFTREADYDSPNFLWFRDHPDSHATLGRHLHRSHRRQPNSSWPRPGPRPVRRPLHPS
jgi:hypothetical protein